MADDGIERQEAMDDDPQAVIQEELMDDGVLAAVHPAIPPDVNVEVLAIQLTKMIRIVGDRLETDLVLQDLMDELERIRGNSFLELARNVLRDRISLERILMLMYLAGRLQVRSVRNLVWLIAEKCANLLLWILHQGRWILELDNSLFVRVILRCTLNFFGRSFLRWIHERGRRDCVHVDRLARRIDIVCEDLKSDPEFQAGINAMAQTPGFSLESWNQVARNAFAQGMTWERITVLLYVFGELAMRMNHWSVRDFLRWMMSFSHSNPLTWAPGRQISRSSEAVPASVNGSSSGLVLTFIVGVALGSFLTWRATRTP